jgi:hypothetical protein
MVRPSRTIPSSSAPGVMWRSPHFPARKSQRPHGKDIVPGRRRLHDQRQPRPGIDDRCADQGRRLRCRTDRLLDESQAAIRRGAALQPSRCADEQDERQVVTGSGPAQPRPQRLRPRLCLDRPSRARYRSRLCRQCAHVCSRLLRSQPWQLPCSDRCGMAPSPPTATGRQERPQSVAVERLARPEPAVAAPEGRSKRC